jgi:hypothetical protein
MLVWDLYQQAGLRRTNSTVENASQAKSAPAAALSLSGPRPQTQKATTKSPRHKDKTD